MKAKFDLVRQPITQLRQERPQLVAFVEKVALASGLSFPYIIASMAVESAFNPNAVNGAAKGILQIKAIAWKVAIARPEFKALWAQLMPGRSIPSGPGKSVNADIIACAALTKRCEEELNIADWDRDTKDKALRLCYHLNPNTAYAKIKELPGSVRFNSADNQSNWNRFLVVLDKAQLVDSLAKAK